MVKGRTGWLKVRNVLIADREQLEKMDVDLHLLGEAVEAAKKDPNRFGWAASGGWLVTADLDEAGKKLITATSYKAVGVYLDPEAAKQEAK